MTAPTLAAGRVEVAGVSTALIDAGRRGRCRCCTAPARRDRQRDWRPIIPALSTDRRVIAADQLGFGETATGERRTYARAAWTDHALALLDTPVRESGAAMFPAPRQRWVDDLALPGAELASIMAPVLLLHGREDRVVPWRSSSAQLVDLLSDGRRHVLSRGGRWTMSERTADFLAVIQPFLAA